MGMPGGRWVVARGLRRPEVESWLHTLLKIPHKWLVSLRVIWIRLYSVDRGVEDIGAWRTGGPGAGLRAACGTTALYRIFGALACIPAYLGPARLGDIYLLQLFYLLFFSCVVTPSSARARRGAHGFITRGVREKEGGLSVASIDSRSIRMVQPVFAGAHIRGSACLCMHGRKCHWVVKCWSIC